MLSPSMHQLFVPLPKFVELVCCKEISSKLKKDNFAKVMLYENGSVIFMPKMELFNV